MFSIKLTGIVKIFLSLQINYRSYSYFYAVNRRGITGMSGLVSEAPVRFMTRKQMISAVSENKLRDQA